MTEQNDENRQTQAFLDDEDAEQSLEALFAEDDNLNDGASSDRGRPVRDISLFNSIPVRLTLEVDTVQVALGELLELQSGEVLALNKKTGEPLDVKVNGQILASAEVVVVDGHYGLRLLDIAEKFRMPGQS